MSKPKSFVIIRGGFYGFSFRGPVRTEALAREWLLPLHNDGIVRELLEPHDYTGKPGTFALVTGNPLTGFSVFGTFSDRLAALHWRDNYRADLDDYWPVEMEEYFQWKG